MSEAEVARLSTDAMMSGDAASRMLGMEVISAGSGNRCGFDAGTR